MGNGRNGSGARRHHRRGPLRTLKRRVKRKLLKYKWLVPALVLAVIVLGGAGMWMMQSVQSGKVQRISANAQFNAGSGYRDIVYKGKGYRYNNRITTILYAGVDAKGALTPNREYTSAPRADSIAVVVLDELNRRMTIIALNRDTMTGIHKYTLNGLDRGVFVDHLGYAYTYGEGGVVSCRNLCTAVSDLLCGVPVNEYVATSRGSIPAIGEALGEVTVVVPNDDLADLGYIAGETAVIDADNLETFVRSRDIGEAFSNEHRMERQRAYINGAADRIRSLFEDRTSEAWEKLETMEGLVQTNITRSRYLALTKALRKTAYNEQDYYIPEGRRVEGKRHDEFYPDPDALQKKVIEIFYMEK